MSFLLASSPPGLASLWRGNLVNILLTFPTNAIGFALKKHLHGVFAVTEDDGGLDKYMKNVLSGTVAGVASLFHLYSLALVQVKLATDVPKGG